MLWVYDHYYFYFFQRWDRLYTPESAVYRRYILTYKDGPRAERVKDIVIRIVLALVFAVK